MTVDSSGGHWVRRAEDAIRRLRDVEGATICLEGDEIREIHVLTTSERSAKHIVRDIQTMLLTSFRRQIDHRVVSVAFAKPEENLTPNLRVSVSPPPQEPKVSATPALAKGRVRFSSVNLFVSGMKAQAQVELHWKGVPRVGNASALASRDAAHRLLVQATLSAVQEFLEDGLGFGLVDLQFLRIGRKEVVVVALELLAHREQKTLVGSCTVEEDAQQAVVLATLSALNRVLGDIPTREPTEYVLGPTPS